jgi:hypothetical protein
MSRVTLSKTQDDNVTILIMTLLIMMILVTLNMDDITNNDILITLNNT